LHNSDQFINPDANTQLITMLLGCHTQQPHNNFNQTKHTPNVGPDKMLLLLGVTTVTTMFYFTEMDSEAQLRLGFMPGTSLCELPTTHCINFFCTQLLIVIHCQPYQDDRLNLQNIIRPSSGLISHKKINVD
jgi:hypothetical protein